MYYCDRAGTHPSGSGGFEATAVGVCTQRPPLRTAALASVTPSHVVHIQGLTTAGM
jgi:hypothetical protein